MFLSKILLVGLFTAYLHLKDDSLMFMGNGHIHMTIVINLSHVSAGVCAVAL